MPSALPTTSTAPTTLTADPTSFRAAFEQTAAARAALPSADLLRINLDIPSVVSTVLGALPKLAALRESIQSGFVAFDLTQFDAIESYASALSYAHMAVLAASAPAEDLPALARRAMRLREIFASDASALVRRGLLDGRRLRDLKKTTGYLAIAYDLGVLVRMLRARWSEIASRSAIEASELDEAEALYERISHACGARKCPHENVRTATDDRVRAFTLLVKAYDQARRAAVFMRWEEDDADELVPSLWAGRSVRRASKAKSNEPRKNPPAEAVTPNDSARSPAAQPAEPEPEPTVAADARAHVEKMTVEEACAKLEAVDDLLRTARRTLLTRRPSLEMRI